MAVAGHLNIELKEYDQRIRTFIPNYEEMLDAAAAGLDLLDEPAPALIELGIGTGALAGRALARRPRATLLGLDADPAIVALARDRLAAHADRVDLRIGDFTQVALPRCHAVLSSIALHHVDRAGKRVLYAAIAEALSPGGMLISADNHVATAPRIAAADRAAWRTHMEQFYTPDETTGYFAAWAHDDIYLPLADELAILTDAGLIADVLWRRGGFAVIAATKPAAHAG